MLSAFNVGHRGRWIPTRQDYLLPVNVLDTRCQPCLLCEMAKSAWSENRLLLDDAAWRGLLAHRPALTRHAKALRETWHALGEVEQWRTMAQIVTCVQLAGECGTISVDFKPALFEVIARAQAQARIRRCPAGRRTTT